MSYEDLRKEVEDNGGVLTCTMEQLRNAHGSLKLGSNVRMDIHDRLIGMGLGHVPEELPTYQENLVRLYQLGTPAAKIIQAVLKPGPDGDARIKDLSGETGSNYADIIAKIRELVEE
ncbi:MAG TPA: hypothetical protein VG826_05375 [Pirellulales bacterium]|nr:hypothetical protein [Pirellulales bacterium]